ncbi:MAG: o-succinylbenzoate synthase [Rhodocyclaceae bacterium]|jgi:o-succinylbenzoate synthase|nr:o-succinylbenzoate synthase [Rhodocyclaceae bacterium]
MRAEVIPYRLPLARPWVAARATLTERRGGLLHLIDTDGAEGWGDCAPLPSGGNAETVLAALDAWACRPGGARGRYAPACGGSPSAARAFTADFQSLPPEVRWAIETARSDLAARRAGVPLWRHLGGTRGEVEVNAALGPLDDGLPARLAAAAAAGFRVGKIKVGLAPVEEEIARLAALEPSLWLRLDANRAWNEADARRFLTAIAGLPIEAVEEPLAAPTLEKLAALQAALPFSLALDESLPQFGIDAVIASRAVRRLVLKPARLGGLAATTAIARAARQAGLEVVLTSVVDSAVGVAAAAHLAAAIAPGFAHGLATSTWLAADVVTPPIIEKGMLRLPATAGLGVTPAAVRAGG